MVYIVKPKFRRIAGVDSAAPNGRERRHYWPEFSSWRAA
jgi:hypothetical protein